MSWRNTNQETDKAYKRRKTNEWDIKTRDFELYCGAEHIFNIFLQFKVFSKRHITVRMVAFHAVYVHWNNRYILASRVLPSAVQLPSPCKRLAKPWSRVPVLRALLSDRELTPACWKKRQSRQCYCYCHKKKNHGSSHIGFSLSSKRKPDFSSTPPYTVWWRRSHNMYNPWHGLTGTDSQRNYR